MSRLLWNFLLRGSVLEDYRSAGFAASLNFQH